MAADLLSFWIIIFFCLLGVIFSSKFRLPSAIGVLLFGMIIGPHGLSLVHETELISLFSEIGAIMLLLFIGIEFSLEKIMKHTLRASVIFIFKLGFMFLFTYILAALFHFSILDALILGVILSLSSTAIFAKLISHDTSKGFEEAKLMSAVLIIEDIFAIFIIAFLSQIDLSNNLLSLDLILFPILISLLVLLFSYIVLKAFVERISILAKGSAEVQLFLVLSICALLSSLAAYLGLSYSVGAFLAGSILSASKVFKTSESPINNLILLFSAFFFFSIGMLVDPIFIYSSLLLILVFTFMLIIFKFLSVSIPVYLSGFDGRSAVFSSLLMLTTSEFALLIAFQINILSEFDFISFVAALLFFSSIISSLLFSREATVSASLNSLTTFNGFFVHIKTFSLYMRSVVRRFEPGGAFYTAFTSNLEKLLSNIGFLVLIYLISFFIKLNMGEDMNFLSIKIYSIEIIDILTIILFLIPISNILKILNVLVKEFAESFHFVTRKKSNLLTRTFADLAFFFIFFVVAFLTPIAISILSLPVSFQMLFIIPLVLSFIFIMDMARSASEFLKSNRRKIKKKIASIKIRRI
ncbi:MAG: cation:proton antiporter [Candidatus ainarchaeum sp.]|nr:cation:proton antiporter [Candidatus ainarchaeum sp.]